MINLILGLSGIVPDSLQITFREEFRGHMFGSTSIATYAAAFLMAFVGALISLRLHALNRDKRSVSTPYKFSLPFLIHDNIARIFYGLLMGFVVFRFFPNILGQDLIMLWALFIGLASDNLAFLFEKIQEVARKKLLEIYEKY